MGVDVTTDVRDLISRSKATDDTVAALTAALAVSGLQPGDLKATAKSTLDAGWLLCDGSSILRSAQPALFAAIGTTYGAVDGTHFTLPDLRGRTAMGAGTAAGAAGATAHALGALGGEETHVLSGAESGVNGNGATGNDTPDHTHHSPSAFPLITANDPAAFFFAAPGTVGSLAINSAPTTSGASVRHAHPLTARAADAAHNNLQPFNVVNWWVKT